MSHKGWTEIREEVPAGERRGEKLIQKPLYKLFLI
jgi:hypothetical protein